MSAGIQNLSKSLSEPTFRAKVKNWRRHVSEIFALKWLALQYHLGKNKIIRTFEIRLISLKCKLKTESPTRTVCSLDIGKVT